jgi:glycerol-3-phosphate dehydrogenase subunit C
MASEGNVSYRPSDGLTYDPNEAKYWDAEALQKEITRAFEICHGCRMCFKYCDSFPSLFSFIDDRHDGDVRGLTERETREVMDLCFQCKLCEVQCPYTPRDGHEFQLDFPKLVHRYQAQRKKREGFTLQDRVLGNPDAAGRMARASLGLANVMNRVSAHRYFFEKIVGVDRRKQLPAFAPQTFSGWAGRAGKLKPPGSEVVLFQTCYVEHNEPEIGKDTIFVLEKNGMDVACAKGLVCCGMPRWERGDIEGLRVQAKQNLDVLESYVDAGANVVVINPTCSMMLRREYPELVAPEDRGRAEKVAERVRDAAEQLWSIRQEERFNTDFKSTPGATIGYHAPCHLRAQAVGFKGRDLMRKIPGTQPVMVMECCGHDGTFAMRKEGFEISQKVGKKSFEGMKASEAEVWSTDCPLAAIQFEQHAGKKPLHPMTVLARAYRADGFPTKLPRPEKDEGAKGEG